MKISKKDKQGNYFYRNKKGEYKLYNRNGGEDPYYSDDPVVKVSSTPDPYEDFNRLKFGIWYDSDYNFFFVPLKKVKAQSLWGRDSVEGILIWDTQDEQDLGYTEISDFKATDEGHFSWKDDEVEDVDFSSIGWAMEDDFQDMIKSIFKKELRINVSKEMSDLLLKI